MENNDKLRKLQTECCDKQTKQEKDVQSFLLLLLLVFIPFTLKHKLIKIARMQKCVMFMFKRCINFQSKSDDMKFVDHLATSSSSSGPHATFVKEEKRTRKRISINANFPPPSH